MKITDKIKLWLNIGRAYTAPTSILPYTFAIVLASKNYNIDYFLSFLGLIGVVLAHLSVNMLDDYFDWKKGAVAEYKKLSEQGIVTITNKCFYLEQNLTTPKAVLFVALLMDAVACLIGLYIALKVGFSVIIIALLAGLMGFFYSAPPFRLSYYGFGEPVIGIIFGPLLMSGAYITAGGSIDKPIILASIAIGALIANVAHTHAVMDFEADKKVGKKSFPILFKTKDRAIVVQALIYEFAYLVILIGIFAKIFPLPCILTFITIPKTVALLKLMKSQDKTKKLWMGAIENWEFLQKEGSDWFMLRLCLSRNIMIDFVVIFGITYYLFGG